MTWSELQLEEAAEHVKGEWILLADMASLLPSSGDRPPPDTAALEATLVHARCLINFCCGGYRGNRHAHDIQPSDFLQREWWPRDESFDRLLRGRLKFINEEMQHLSWERVLNKEPLAVPMGFLAHQVHWAMHLFVEELAANESRWHPDLHLQEQYVTTRLPPRERWAETTPHLAPPRQNPIPPT